MTAIDRFEGEWAFLSNFHPSVIVIQGIEFPTAEHAFQAGKVATFGETMAIASQTTPKKAKLMGRKLPLREDWENRKDDWMKRVVYEKFRQHPTLASKLQATGDALLIEGNTWHDQIWGNCTCAQHRDKPGDNQLGHILMKTRTDLAGGNPQ